MGGETMPADGKSAGSRPVGNGPTGSSPAISRSTSTRRRQRLLAGTAMALLVLATGCASMPHAGPVETVTESPHTDGDSEVRIIGVRPQKTDDARSLVRGFLEATTSDEADYDTARLYLGKAEQKRWDPDAGITVLTGSPSLSIVHNRDPDREETQQLSLTGDLVARVDRKHAYKPVSSAHHATFHAMFHLTKQHGQWRIDTLDNGLVLSLADFQRMYHSVNMYYFTASPGRKVLVPDPVYLRRHIDTLRSTVRTLLDGPTDWLSPVVTSRFPQGTALDGRQGIEIKNSDTLRVRLRGDLTSDQGRCRDMAAQLLKTAEDQSAMKFTSVQIARDDGSVVCSLSDAEERAYDPLASYHTTNRQYFVDAQRRLVRLTTGEDGGVRPVPGPFGDGQVKLGSVAVRLDGGAAAGVKPDGRSLYVADLVSGAQTGRPVLTSRARTPAEGLTAPSWDGFGDLWVADRDPRHARLLVLRDREKIAVDVPDLGTGRITALRVAPDGTRIALLVRDGGRTTLELGRVERTGAAERPQIAVKDLRQVAPQLEDVAAVSWAGLSRLLVVGRESEGVQQMQYVDTDGSMPYSPPLPAISGVTAVATSADQSQPILADCPEGIYQLPPDGNWTRVASKGASPAYPG
jgi:Lipoprotein LpqB beta-propeller domain/Sporulation and spore germination